MKINYDNVFKVSSTENGHIIVCQSMLISFLLLSLFSSTSNLTTYNAIILFTNLSLKVFTEYILHISFPALHRATEPYTNSNPTKSLSHRIYTFMGATEE